MKLCTRFIILFLMFSGFAAYAHDTGSVCLGPYLSVVWHDPASRPYLTIGDNGPFRFNRTGQSSGLAIQGLDTKAIYRVKIHFQGRVIQSWDLDFEKTGSIRVCIWRDKGAWRMEPVEKSKCRCSSNAETDEPVTN